jgi:hypothetical protein
VLRWPALATLAVTLLRLGGELREGPPPWFSPLPGGGLALVGIAWLVPLVGLYCGFALQRRGLRPESPWVSGLAPVVVLALAPALPWAANRLQETSWTVHLGLWAITSVFVALLAWASWPALGRLLLLYAALARVPVIVVTAVATWRHWGTHYDAVPPGFPPLPALERWLFLGLLPQATIWVGLTVASGAVFGVLGWLLASRAAASR